MLFYRLRGLADFKKCVSSEKQKSITFSYKFNIWVDAIKMFSRKRKNQVEATESCNINLSRFAV
jgi:hypothetical protein